MKRLDAQQKERINCIKKGHAKFVTVCFGYVYCGRCEDQIGDTLGGIFDLTDYMILGHKCKTCNIVRRKLTKKDLKYVLRWEKEHDD